jgi:pyrrolidone-carboxylate peptidase
MPNRSLLVSGFTAFGEIQDNPAAWLAERCGAPFALLPVSYARAEAWLTRLQDDPPARLLMLGVAANRPHFSLELFGWNAVGAGPDVEGEVAEVWPSGPTYVNASLWTPTLAAKIVVQGHAKLSGNPGDYLCNFMAYRAPFALPQTASGFLHVPGDAHMPRERMLQHLRAILALIGD